MSRNKCFFQVPILPVLRVMSICDLLTDSPSHLTKFIEMFSSKFVLHLLWPYYVVYFSPVTFLVEDSVY
jgi:hypothetical protein